MTATRDPKRRPRTWDELRQRVLDQDYMDAAELERRRRRAHQMKYALWLIPVMLAGVTPTVIEEGVWWFPVVAILGVTYGAIEFYRLGVRWERRWDNLIREKSAPGGPHR